MALTQVHRIWTDYKPDQTGQLVGTDWIEIGPPGKKSQSTSVHRVNDLARVLPRDSDTTNPAIELANDLWDFIKPHYEAWKKGQDAPETGTPLAAWNALTPEMGEVFRTKGIRTVEDIAEMTDSVIRAVPLPNIRKLIEQAKLFLKSREQSVVALDLMRKDEQIVALQAQMAELMASLKANDRTGALEPLEKRKGGRPPGSKNKPKEQVAA